MILSALTRSSNAGIVELSAVISGTLKKGKIWFRCPEEYGSEVSAELYDPFVVALVQQAISSGEVLTIDGPVSDRLVLNLTYFARIYGEWFGHNPLYLQAASIVRPTNCKGRIVTGMSCGVDSLTTALELHASAPRARITHFVHCNVGSHGHGDAARALFQKRLHKAEAAAKEIRLPLIWIDSNIDDFLSVRFEDSYASRTAAAAHFLGCSEYFIASTNTYTQIGPEGSSPLSDHLLSSERVQIFHDGAHLNRIQKLDFIKSWKPAQHHLNVCTRSTTNAENCSSCSKCLRTILAICLLEAWPSFKDVFSSVGLDRKLKAYVNEMNSLGAIPPNFYWMEIVEFANQKGLDLQKHPIQSIELISRANWRKPEV